MKYCGKTCTCCCYNRDVQSIERLLCFLLPYLQELHYNMELEAASGRSVLAVLVFAHALRYFKNCCIRELNEQSTSCTAITADDIQWVITVPAIWRQSAKQFMRHAATEVRLTPREHSPIVQ